VTTAGLVPMLATAFIGARSYAAEDLQQARRLRRVYWLLVVIEIVWTIPSGGRSNLIALALMAVILRYYGTRQRIPWKTIIVSGLLIGFLAFPFIAAYRKGNVYQTNQRQAFNVAKEKTFEHGLGGLLGSGATATFGRFSDVTSLALIESRPRRPLGGSPGKTLTWIPQTFIPRALLKTKDDPGRIGNEFGVTYDLTATGFRGTSIAISQVGEFYLNFGLLGLIVGMPLVGAVYRVIGDYFGARRSDSAILAVYAVAAWQLVNGQETIVALGLFGVFKAMLFFAVLILLTTAIQRRRASLTAARERPSESPA
jgi:hypothetical protein